jgi:hypothetical protein
MASRGILGYISSGINLKSLRGLNSLRKLWRIKQRKELRCLGWIMVESFVEINSNNYVRRVI